MVTIERKKLEEKAKWIRRQILEMCVCGRCGHIASSFSCTEILVALYHGGILHFDPANPNWDRRDRFILSKGHAAPALYSVLADVGFFPISELHNFAQPGSILGGHSDNNVPGIELVTGSLGHGLGFAAGLALSAKMDKKDYMVVSLLGDGECYEGPVWEAAIFASHHQLNNLVAIIDRNLISVTDFTENYLHLEPLKNKWESFGWNAATIDGHSFEELFAAFQDFRSHRFNQPFMIIANTIKGKGVSFMENNPLSHTMIPNGEQLEISRSELNYE